MSVLPKPNMVQIHDIHIQSLSDLFYFSLLLLREGVGQNIIVSSVALSLLVRHPKHLRQDVRRTECGVHLLLAQVASFVSSFKLLQIKSNYAGVGKKYKNRPLSTLFPHSLNQCCSLWYNSKTWKCLLWNLPSNFPSNEPIWDLDILQLKMPKVPGWGVYDLDYIIYIIFDIMDGL